MGNIWLGDLPTILGGLGAEFYSGWETRSRSSGGYDGLVGIAIHHTASNTSAESDMHYMWSSASDRPIGAIYLGRDGRIVVGCAGATNTQGKGGPLNTSRGTVPKDQGNQYLLAIEAANAGTGEPWPDVQQDRYVALVRALCDGYAFTHLDVFGHYDYCAPSCPGRKIDPAGPSRFGSVNSSGTWDINVFRDAVLGGEPTPQPPTPEPTPPPEEDWMANLPTIRKGDSGPDVKRMQHLLAAAGYMQEGNTANYDGLWQDGTDGAKQRFDHDHGLLPSPPTDCGDKSWRALMGL